MWQIVGVADVGEYLYYPKSKCRKRLIDKVVKEGDENIDENEMVYNAILNDYGTVYKSFTLYIAFLILAFIMVMGIGGVYFYFCWHTIKNWFNKLFY